ncbi:MAG: LytTR family DNA-binding domain-containing protein [Bacteroidota bacterium]
MRIHCMAVDDEPLARECIANYVREIDFLNWVGSASNPLELGQILDKTPVDLLFLDIQMPRMNGIDYLKSTSPPPMVILTTAFPSYALEGYELKVLDYLLKPITFNRFFQAANKAKEFHTLRHTHPGASLHPPEEAFFIKCDHKYEKIYVADILYVQAMQNYVHIFTTQGKYTTLLYLKNVEENLDPQRFIRVHKSYIVAIERVETIQDNEICIQSHRIPISRNYKEVVMEKVLKGRLWKR